MNSDTPLIIVASDTVPPWAPVPWYKKPLLWLRILNRKPMAVWTEAGVLQAHSSQVERVAEIFRDEGYTVVTGRARTPASPDRARWAASPKPSHNYNKTPQVTRPNLRPVRGDDK